MRGLITRLCPPAESVLLAAEKDMNDALADANRALRAGDLTAHAQHMARLYDLTKQATEIVRRVA